MLTTFFGQSKIYPQKAKLKRINFRDGVILEDTSYFLLLPSVGPADEGNYSCSAVNSIGKGPSDSLHLDIAGKYHLQ